MRPRIRLGISPCPNDIFMFYALIHHKVSFLHELEIRVKDVEELNRMALRQDLDICKVSYHAAGILSEHYEVLDAGSALGWGCGPIVVVRPGEYNTPRPLKGKRIAIPGKYTTAHLLLRLYEPEVGETIPVLFSEIPIMVKDAVFDAGVIIHESRFTYRDLGLRVLVDLGRWWEDSFGLPIPLGGIVAKRSLDPGLKQAFTEALKESIEYAWGHMEEIMPFLKMWAQEIHEDVIKSHICLYVNEYSMDLGDLGKKAVDFLFRLGIERGIFSERTASCHD